VTRRTVIAVSSCLLGTPCRYDGGSKPVEWVQALADECVLLPICPEMLAGMGVPRPPIEHHRRHGSWRVETPTGEDKMRHLAAASQKILHWCTSVGAAGALLKERSPSCGVNTIHADGALVKGRGVTANRLVRAGIPSFSEEQREQFLSWLGARTATSEPKEQPND